MNGLSQKTAQHIFQTEWERLTPHEREVIEGVLHRLSSPRDTNQEFLEQRTFGERAADTIAAFGGSWTFVILFCITLLLWAFVNTEILGPRKEAFDPYPYVFLNLILSMLAAVQAPIIMMAQNRQSARDRLDAEIDHEVNVRSELMLHSVEERLEKIEAQLSLLTGTLIQSERQETSLLEPSETEGTMS